ncbi:glycosyltransferase [Sellimonas catena]|uniref:Glycosyltransferase 2-like domain-containing protein n=1 Tax=Sellimonas catena TaxID=2994035 RepID=A0A9W6C808_9FIRM|nr:glycosyltransferase [Sellimonas catena]GLG06124.1 hypothetical protein Selli1_32980 [Sellimonas catena]
MERSKKILILLSTYNGEKYLSEQLDSILNQEGVTIDCLIRDDGSTDRTSEILKKYSDKNKNIKYYLGENIGVVNSFNNLMMRQETNDYEWIAFCDQDDIWLPQKLINAIKQLENLNKKARLYCSNLKVVDKNLKYLSTMKKNPRSINKYKAMVENIATGCTCVFNQQALLLYRRGIGCTMEMHDYWMYLVNIFMGEVVYDPACNILYRQHEKNVVGGKKKKIRKAIKNIINPSINIRRRMLQDFEKTYMENLSNSDRKIIEEIINYNISFAARLKVFLNYHYRGYTWNVTIGFKLRVLLGNLY